MGSQKETEITSQAVRRLDLLSISGACDKKENET